MKRPGRTKRAPSRPSLNQHTLFSFGIIARRKQGC